MDTKIVPLGMIRTPDAFQLPPAVIDQEVSMPPPPPRHPTPPMPTLEPVACPSIYSDGLRSDFEEEDEVEEEEGEEDEDDAEDPLAFLEDLPSPEDEALLRENARTTKQMFRAQFPEFEQYLIDHHVDKLPGNVGLLVRHFLLKTPRPLYVVPVLESTKITSFEYETDDMFLTADGLRPRSKTNPLDDLWEARDMIGAFLDKTVPTTAPSFLTTSDRISLRIHSTNMHRGLINHLKSGGVLTDTVNLALLSDQDADTLVRLAGYRRSRIDRALARSPERMLEHVMLDTQTLFEMFPCFTYFCLLQSQRRSASTDSYARIVEIVLHTQRTPVYRVVRDLCQPDTVFWLHLLRMSCNEAPRLWAVLGAHTPALAALVSFISRPRGATPGRDFSVESVVACVHNILGTDLPEQEDDTFTSVSAKIQEPRWSEVFAGIVRKL